MFTKLYSATTIGIDSNIVTVEVDISIGLIQWHIVGLPDAAVKESKQRIAAAIKNSGIKYPDRKVTVNLSPADMKKEGSIFDFAITVALLDAVEIISIPKFLKDDAIFIGEIGLDGNLIGARGVLAIAADAIKLNKKYIIVPFCCAEEAFLIKNIQVIAPKSLHEFISWIISENIQFYKADNKLNESCEDIKYNMSDVYENNKAKRALQIAAAGHHATLLIGSPGSGKTLLAERLPGLLPKMTIEEKIEVTKIYSVSGKLKNRKLISDRPFNTPHHTISMAGLVGGGSIPQPGAISLSHKGVLFLDEFLEYRRNCIEVLRQPLESRKITISRANAEYTFPADFLMIAATNPCPCGYYGDSRRKCSCSQFEIKSYLQKLSGPLIDRIDLHVGVYSNEKPILGTKEKEISTEDLVDKIIIARNAQKNRFNNLTFLNGHMSGTETIKYCKISPDAKKTLDIAYEKLSLSNRGYFKVIKIAQTIADLEGADLIELSNIQEALSFRIMDTL
jgi:magnesium chelatase family protein